MIKSSISHLKDNKMTYWQHFMFAFGHGVGCLIAGICLMCHAIIPAIFPTAGSSLVSYLNKSFINRNNES